MGIKKNNLLFDVCFFSRKSLFIPWVLVSTCYHHQCLLCSSFFCFVEKFTRARVLSFSRKYFVFWRWLKTQHERGLTEAEENILQTKKKQNLRRNKYRIKTTCLLFVKIRFFLLYCCFVIVVNFLFYYFSLVFCYFCG